MTQWRPGRACSKQVHAQRPIACRPWPIRVGHILDTHRHGTRRWHRFCERRSPAGNRKHGVRAGPLHRIPAVSNRVGRRPAAPMELPESTTVRFARHPRQTRESEAAASCAQHHLIGLACERDRGLVGRWPATISSSLRPRNVMSPTCRTDTPAAATWFASAQDAYVEAGRPGR